MAEGGLPTRIEFVPKPFEDFALDDVAGPFAPDLMFTSPPFFDFETYNDGDARQSTSVAPTFDGWLAWFVAAAVKAYGLIRPGGYLAYYFVDFRPRGARKPSEAVIAAVRLAGGAFRGVIAARRGAKRPIPVWVFQKPE